MHLVIRGRDPGLAPVHLLALRYGLSNRGSAKVVSTYKASKSITLQKMAAKCSLGHPFQQWMIAFAQSTKFTAPSPQMLEMVAAFCQSWCQSRINEQGNKSLRDGAHRANASKVSHRSTSRYMNEWRSLLCAGLCAHICISPSLSLSLYIYIYVCWNVCVYYSCTCL